MPVPATDDPHEDLNRIAAYLALRDVSSLTPAVGPRVDVLVLCGSAVLASIEVAASAFHDGLGGRLLVLGGAGHSTPYLRHAVGKHPRYRDVPTAARAESAIIADVLRRHHGVPDAAIAIETESTNCGENAAFGVALLDRIQAEPRSLLLIQDPTMQRRTHESFRRALRGWSGVRLWSYAPFVPNVPYPVDGHAVDRHIVDQHGRPVWAMSRFTELVLGEIRRLRDDGHGYGPRGADFIDHVDIPADVLTAYERLAASNPESIRVAWRRETNSALPSSGG